MQGGIFCISSIADRFLQDLFFHFPQNCRSFFAYRKMQFCENQAGHLLSALSKQEAMGTRKTQRKRPRGKALHNELEIATAGNTVAAFPARAVTSHSNFSLKQTAELSYSITKHQGFCCSILRTLETTVLQGMLVAFFKEKQARNSPLLKVKKGK